MARSDVQLMLDVKAGDEQSFTLLLHRYRSPLVNFLYRMVRNREQAEDLAQEVFLRVYRAREDYVPSAKLTTWLFRIATNLALNSLRDTRYQRMEISLDAPVTVDAEEGEEKALDVAEKHANIEQHLVEETRRKMIHHAIEKLPEKQRAAVLLHKYQELDYGEISKILQCSESALKSLLLRAYESLRVAMVNAGAASGDCSVDAGARDDLGEYGLGEQSAAGSAGGFCGARELRRAFEF